MPCIFFLLHCLVLLILMFCSSNFCQTKSWLFSAHLKRFWCCQFHVCFVNCGFQGSLWCLLSSCLDCLQSWWVFNREHEIFEEVSQAIFVSALSFIVSMLKLYFPFVNSFILQKLMKWISTAVVIKSCEVRFLSNDTKSIRHFYYTYVRGHVQIRESAFSLQ